MGIIHLLEESVQNKIAAGEVVERPSAAIKEMLENSIDAGATMIRVDLEEGGKKLIRIIDNGNGIYPEDLLLTVKQHATSKINNADDLFAVKTMGFRGEALASISSVTQFQITSRKENLDAFSLKVEGGRVGEVMPASGPKGTTIEARNLFFNTPVRLKFLKAENTELGRCHEVISCLAMAYPEVGFVLTHNGREQLQLPGNQTYLERIGCLLPLNIVDSLIEFPEFDGGFFKISGFLGSPYTIRPKRDFQYMFVNGRVVKDKLLQGAISKMYEGVIPSGKHPVVIIYLTIDPSEVDVNVHPTKYEVRFTQSGSIFSALLKIGNDILKPRQPEIPQKPSILAEEISAHKSFSFESPVRNHPSQGAVAVSPAFDLLGALKDIYSENKPSADYHDLSVREEVASVKTQSLFDPFEKLGNSPVLQNEVVPSIVSASNIITINKTFLIAGIGDELYMIDQHAIHERMLFEKLTNGLASGSLGIQQLLYPINVSMKDCDKQVLLSHVDEMERLGFLIEDFGKDGLLVRGVPVDAKKLDIESFFADLVSNFEFQEQGDLDKARHKFCATVACHSSYRAGDEMTHKEKEALFYYANKNKDVLTCPHGRPTLVVYSVKDFTKMFYR